MRLPPPTSGLLFAIALAAGCKCQPKSGPAPTTVQAPVAVTPGPGTAKHAAVERLCRALYPVPEPARSDAGTGTADCVRLLGGSADLGAVTFDNQALSGCGAALEQATAGAPLPQGCTGIIQGTREKGAHCASSLECRKGLHCGGAAPNQIGLCIEPGPPGAPCGFAPTDALIDITRQEGAKREHPECLGTCEHRRCR